MKPYEGNLQPEDSQEFSDAVVRLNKDLKAAVRLLTPHEARFLVDSYYAIQEYRKASGNQKLALDKSGEPHLILNWLFDQQSTLEKQIGKTLDIWTDTQPVGQWLKSICGIGPVLTAGLIAHVDITRAPTAGRIWRLAGLVPDVKWYGKDGSKELMKTMFGDSPKKKSVDETDLALVSLNTNRSIESLEKLALGKGKRMTMDNLEAGLARRPWNANLKTLAFKVGESFVKVSGRESDFYGKLFQKRKAKEWLRNLSGGCSGDARNALSEKNFKDGTDAKVWLTGKISPSVAGWCWARGIVSSSPSMNDVEAMTKDQALRPADLVAAGFWNEDGSVVQIMGKGPDQWTSPIPMLPPAHIHARARRWTVKLLLSHFQYVYYRYHYGQEPPAPYVMAKAGHADLIVPPNLPWKDFFGVPV
jgi:hypothetical protein